MIQMIVVLVLIGLQYWAVLGSKYGTCVAIAMIV